MFTMLCIHGSHGRLDMVWQANTMKEEKEEDKELIRGPSTGLQNKHTSG